jgi:hypothetical protein
MRKLLEKRWGKPHPAPVDWECIMDTDQKVDQVQRGVAVPCLVIFTGTYVLGVFLSCFLVQREYELSPAILLAVLIPLFAPLLAMGYFQYYSLSVLEPIIFFVVFSLLVWHLYLARARKSLLVIALMIAAIWLISINFVAINLKIGA